MDNREREKKIKDILFSKAYKYESELEQEIPIDEDGEIRQEYLSYVSLNNMHNLIESVSKDVAHIIIEKRAEEDDSVKAYVKSSFYVISNSLMDELMDIMLFDGKINEEREERKDEDPDFDDESFNA